MVKEYTRKGKTRYVIDIRYRTPEGLKGRYRRDAQVQKRAAAEAEDRRLVARLVATGTLEPVVVEPKVAKAAAPTWSEAVKRYRAVVLPTVRHQTAILYKKILDSAALAAWSDLAVEKIDLDAMQRLDAALIAGGIGPSRRRHFAAVYRGVLRSAVAEGFIPTLPLFPTLPKVPIRVPAVPSLADVEAILGERDANAGTYRARQRRSARLAFHLAAHAGLRAGEVRGARWGDVDLVKRTIAVRTSRAGGVEGPPKSGADRVVPLSESVVDALRPAMAEAMRRAKGAPIHDVFVAVRWDGKPWGDTGLLTALRRACARLEIRGARYHALRHFFVTRLFEGGAAAPTVQLLAGHQSLAVTQRYAHAALPHMRAAVAIFDGQGHPPPVPASQKGR